MTDSLKPDFKYWAFISYSHRDKAWGDWLHRSLETYKVPKKLVGRKTSRGEDVPKRVFPVFRDREELPTAADLGANLRNAIEQSRYLLIICSPNSARSQWVNEEILSFKRLGRENRVLALIVDGEPYASDGKAGFTADQECFPEALRYKLGGDGELSEERTEPIAGDARPHADGKRQALIKLLAGVIGVNYDELRQRERARRRRRRLWLGVAALTVAIGALFVQSRFVSEQRERQFQAATAELGRARDALNDNQPAKAAIAALSAIDTATDAGSELEPAWWVLRRALDANRVENRWMAAVGEVQECGFDREGKRLLTFNAAEGDAKIWSVPDGRLIATCTAGEYAGLAGWLPDRDQIVTVRSWEKPAESWDEPGSLGVDLAWWDPATGTQLRSLTLPNCYYLGLRHQTDSLPEWIHVTDTGGEEPVFRLVRLSDGWADQTLPTSKDGGSGEPVVVSDCNVVLLVDSSTGISVYPLGKDASKLGQLEGIDPQDRLRLTSIVPSTDGASFAALLWSGRDLLRAGAWRAADGRQLASLAVETLPTGSNPWMRPIAPDYLASRSTEVTEALASALGRKALTVPAYVASGFVWRETPTRDDPVAVALDSYGSVSILRPQAGWEAQVELDGADAATIALSPDGSLAAIGDDRGQITLWRTDTPFQLESVVGSAIQADLDATYYGPNKGNKLLLRTGSGEAQIWDIAQRRVTATARGFAEPQESWLRFLMNPESNWLVTVPSLPFSGPVPEGSKATFHDLDTGRILGRRPAANFTLSPTGRRALAFQDGAWRVVRADGETLIDTNIASSRTARSEWSGAARFSADGSEVIVATADGCLEIFDAKSGESLREIRFADDLNTSINQLVIAPSGGWALLSTYNTWWQVDLVSGASKIAFADEPVPDPFGDRAFLHQEQLLVGTAGGMTKWWRFPELTPIAQVTGEYLVSATVAAANKLLLQSRWDKELILVDQDSGAILSRFANVVAVDATGRFAAIEDESDDDGRIRVIRIEDSETLAELTGLRVNSAAIAPDGTRALFITSEDARLVSISLPFDPHSLKTKAIQLRDRFKGSNVKSQVAVD